MLSSSSEEKWKWTQIRSNLNFKKKKRSNNLQLFKISQSILQHQHEVKVQVEALCCVYVVPWNTSLPTVAYSCVIWHVWIVSSVSNTVCVRTKLEGPLVGALRGGEALFVLFVRRRRWKAGTRLLRLWQRREPRLVLAVTTVTWKQFTTLCNAVVLIICCASSHRSRLCIHSALLIGWVTLTQQWNGSKTTACSEGRYTADSPLLQRSCCM